MLRLRTGVRVRGDVDVYPTVSISHNPCGNDMGCPGHCKNPALDVLQLAALGTIRHLGTRH
jgi:hypothetical protein